MSLVIIRPGKRLRAVLAMGPWCVYVHIHCPLWITRVYMPFKITFCLAVFTTRLTNPFRLGAGQFQFDFEPFSIMCNDLLRDVAQIIRIMTDLLIRDETCVAYKRC